MNGISTLIKGPTEVSLPSSTMYVHSEKTAVYETKAGPHQIPNRSMH